MTHKLKELSAMPGSDRGSCFKPPTEMVLPWGLAPILVLGLSGGPPVPRRWEPLPGSILVSLNSGFHLPQTACHTLSFTDKGRTITALPTG